MDNGLIPQRYAKALYKFASEKGETGQMYELSKVVIKSFQENPELQKVLANPYVSSQDKDALLVAAAGEHHGDIYGRFIALLIENKRISYAYQIMMAYRDLYRKENHISQARITTATPLEKDLLDKLRKIVASSFKDSTLEFSEAVNPKLIGGFIIDVDSVRMDASISNELEQLRQTLLRS